MPRNAFAATRRMARQPVVDAFKNLDIAGFVDVWFSDETQGSLAKLMQKLKARG